MFGPKNDERRSAAIRSLKTVARELFEVGEDDVIVVTELACTEPGCPPLETVIALLRAGSPPRQVKVHKPVVSVTEQDLRDAFADGPGHHRAHG